MNKRRRVKVKKIKSKIQSLQNKLKKYALNKKQTR